MNGITKQATAVVCLSTNSGGMEHGAIAIATNMSTFCSRVILVTRADAWLFNRAQERGLTVEPVSMRTNVSLRGVFKLKRIWEKHGIRNIVYLGSSEMPTLFLSLIAQDISLIVRHGTTKTHSKKDFVHRLTWSKVRSHWCISKHIKSNVERIFPTEGKSLFLAYTSQSHKFSDIPLARSDLGAADRPALVHVGRLQVDKGQRDAVYVISMLVKAGVSANLTLYGDGPDYQYLVRLAKTLGVEENVYFKGDVDRPYQYFNQFDAFLFPSYGEGLPNAVLEALYSEIPCFAYSNTVFPELAELGLQIQTVQQGDYRALGQLVLDSYRSGRCTLRTNNRRIVKEVFSLPAEQAVLSNYLR